jgi:SAM-dependent methyltransferase
MSRRVSDVSGFYDALSEDYHLASSGWRESVERFGRIFDELLVDLLGRPGPFDVLDCACGIGQQAIGIAQRGHRVHGSDLSGASLARAERDARALGFELTTTVADMRRLDVEVGGDWDAVVCAGNSSAHLDAQGLRELAASARAVLRPEGWLLVHGRNYDELRKERPRITPGHVTDTAGGKRIIFQVWDWSEAGDAYTLNWFDLAELDGQFEVRRDSTFLHARTCSEIEDALQEAGLVDVESRTAHNPGGAGVVVVGRRR